MIPRAGDTVIAIAAFLIISFGARLSLNYFREGILLYSAINATIWTMVSALIFIPLSQHAGLWKTSIIGSVVYVAIFLFVYLYAFVPSHLTLKMHDIFLFRDGLVTSWGIVTYMGIAISESIIAIIALSICFRSIRTT